MNGEDSFEKRLQGVEQRPIPPAWRREILSTAREAARVRAPALAPGSWLQTRLRELLWPHPVAWAGLAAVWLFVLISNFAVEAPRPEFIARSRTPSPQERQLLLEQQQLLAELVGPNAAPVPERQKPGVPQPRGEYREPSVKI